MSVFLSNVFQITKWLQIKQTSMPQLSSRWQTHSQLDTTKQLARTISVSSSTTSYAHNHLAELLWTSFCNIHSNSCSQSHPDDEYDSMEEEIKFHKTLKQKRMEYHASTFPVNQPGGAGGSSSSPPLMEDPLQTSLTPSDPVNQPGKDQGVTVTTTVEMKQPQQQLKQPQEEKHGEDVEIYDEGDYDHDKDERVPDDDNLAAEEEMIRKEAKEAARAEEEKFKKESDNYIVDNPIHKPQQSSEPPLDTSTKPKSSSQSSPPST